MPEYEQIKNRFTGEVMRGAADVSVAMPSAHIQSTLLRRGFENLLVDVLDLERGGAQVGGAQVGAFSAILTAKPFLMLLKNDFQRNPAEHWDVDALEVASDTQESKAA